MRRALPYVISLLLGVSAAFVAACAGDTKGGIPAASAGELKSQIDDVRERVAGGDCNELNSQLRQIDQGIDALPSTVDERLKQALRDGATRLRERAPSECSDNDITTQTQTQTQTTPAETTTETTPAETTTETTPAETTTQTTPVEPVAPVEPTPTVPAPPPVEPPPPPVNPGGGTEPQIP